MDEGNPDSGTSEDVVAWTQMAMQRLQALTDEPTQQRILTGCACHYPTAELAEIRAQYTETGDIDLAHRMLQAKFKRFLVEELALSNAQADEVIRQGWGLAGIRQGRTIVATNIPKSGNFHAYMAEPDPDESRRLYCHCPRVREALERDETLPTLYCYCGAGFYKGIWEEILQRPVDVDVLETVLSGGDVCRVAVYLPEDVAPDAD